ncbi:MAG: phosphatase PAP2 family protein [Fusobacteriaceae bacterium]|nr:phosphatase PAP2 family protein [Fusobacteriaceae bacterium]
MKKLVVLMSFILSSVIFAEEFWGNVIQDYQNYYLYGNYAEAGAVFLVGGLMANTNVDQWIRDEYQTKIRNNPEYGTDEINEQSAIDKTFGEGKIIIPVALTAKFLGAISGADFIETWGDSTSRAYLVGFPSLLLLQRVTGGSRPAEQTSDETSNWNYFNDDNGVSGHAYMGSVPFIVAANMSDSKIAKGFFYVASTLTGLSRINDDAHFTSQVILGWYLGYASVKSVFNTNEGTGRYSSLKILPFIDEDRYGLYLSYKN